ncbi:E3 ubiquitin-protein ligase TRIM71-like [Stylophora pistillata]|nr:E3 ubiquitin-protein ligase TRIM71-like [Stylophora pistillata]
MEELIRRPVMCSEQYHQDQPLEYYCQDCNVCTCIRCSVVSHNRHTLVDMQKAADEQKMHIHEALKKMEAKVVICENEMKEQTELIHKNKTQISAAREKMNETVNDCIRLLTEHKAMMDVKFDEINQAQQKAHVAHLEDFQLAVAQLKSSLEQAEKILERNIDVEILRTQPVIIGRCEDLLNAKKPDIYKPPRVNYVVEHKMDILDRVLVNHTDSSSTLVKGLCEKVKEQNETCFTIITRDSEGRQCYNKDDHINCDFHTSTGDKSQMDLKIENEEDGSYRVKYTPDHSGLYDVKIEVNGHPLDGSPWTVQVIHHEYKLKFSFGSCGTRAGNFHYPCGVAVSEKTGTIAISDYWNDRIQLFNSKWNFLNEVRLGTPCSSVSFTESDQIIAATPQDDNKICLFAEDGKFVQHISSMHLQCPFHISVGKGDCIITSDPVNHVFGVISPDGTELLKRFRASEHHDSIKCTIYHEEKFFVSDREAHRVGVFDEYGKLLYNIGSEESGDGHLGSPIGLAIDIFNNLLVCDVENSTVQVFTLDGKFVSMFGLSPFVPHYVAVSKNGDVFVTDHHNHCVHVFH